MPKTSTQHCARVNADFDAASASSTSGVVDRTVLPVRLAIVRFYAASAAQDGSRN